jgi:hypothetical protein
MISRVAVSIPLVVLLTLTTPWVRLLVDLHAVGVPILTPEMATLEPNATEIASARQPTHVDTGVQPWSTPAFGQEKPVDADHRNGETSV